MDRPSNKFLASAGLALDEGRERGVGYLPDLLNNLLHLPTRAHQPLQRALDNPGCLPQLARALLDGSLQFVGAALQRQLLLPDPATQLARLNRPAHRAALHFLLPTGDSRSGRRSFDSKLISLLPLDEVPVHVPLRRPRPLRFARLRVPVWNPYSRGRLSPAKSEDRKGGEGKTDANLTIFFSTCCAWRRLLDTAGRRGPSPRWLPHPLPR